MSVIEDKRVVEVTPEWISKIIAENTRLENDVRQLELGNAELVAKSSKLKTVENDVRHFESGNLELLKENNILKSDIRRLRSENEVIAAASKRLEVVDWLFRNNVLWARVDELTNRLGELLNEKDDLQSVKQVVPDNIGDIWSRHSQYLQEARKTIDVVQERETQRQESQVVEVRSEDDARALQRMNSELEEKARYIPITIREAEQEVQNLQASNRALAAQIAQQRSRAAKRRRKQKRYAQSG